MTGCSTHWFREKMGLSQKELAEKFDIPIGTVKNWDARYNMPKYIDAMFFEIVTLNDNLKNERIWTETYLKNR